MEHDDLKARLLKPRIGEEEVTLPGLGIVRVRGLTRVEALKVQEQPGPRQYDAMTIALGMVNPKFSFDEALQWQEASPAGEIDPVTDKIAALSGMTKTSAKEAYRKFEDEPGAEFRVPASPEAEHDGRPATGVDE